MAKTKTKSYRQWLVINWKTGESRTRKNKPKSGELKANELLAELKVDVEVPEVDVPTLAVQIDVPEPQVYQAVLDGLSDEELPDFSNAVHDVVAENREIIDGLESAGSHQTDRVVDQLTTKALLESPGRPPTDQVREYVEQVVTAAITGENDV